MGSGTLATALLTSGAFTVGRDVHVIAGGAKPSSLTVATDPGLPVSTSQLP